MQGRKIIDVCILFLLFCISPFLAALLSLYLIYRKRYVKLGVYIIIIFWGLVGYTFLPADNMDITRHNLNFENLQNISSLQEFIIYQSLSEKPDFILDLVFWGIGKFIKSHQVVGFIGAFCYYGLGLGMLLHWREQLHTKSSFNNFILLILMFLALAQVTEFSGMRQGNAILLFLFIITIPDEQLSIKKKCISLLLPCLLHFSMYPLMIFYISACLMNRRYVFLISICMLIGSFYFMPFMTIFMNLMKGMGSIGTGIANKIDTYIFGEELSVALYSGSGVRFYVIILMMIIFPIVAYKLDRFRFNMPSFILHLHYWGIMFFTYTLFTSSSYILSRNIMMFKMFAILYFTYALFSCKLGKYMQQLLACLCIVIVLSGPISMWRSEEYNVINPSVFYSDIVTILNIKTRAEGY